MAGRRAKCSRATWDVRANGAAPLHGLRDRRHRRRLLVAPALLLLVAAQDAERIRRIVWDVTDLDEDLRLDLATDGSFGVSGVSRSYRLAGLCRRGDAVRRRRTGGAAQLKALAYSAADDVLYGLSSTSATSP